MKPIEIIQQLRQTIPDVLGKVLNPREAAILRASFADIAKLVRESTSGEVQIPDLDRFVVRQVQREVDRWRSAFRQAGDVCSNPGI